MNNEQKIYHAMCGQCFTDPEFAVEHEKHCSECDKLIARDEIKSKMIVAGKEVEKAVTNYACGDGIYETVRITIEILEHNCCDYRDCIKAD